MRETETNPGGELIAISECEICSQLAEVETSFSKYGWDDMTRTLPPAAARLVPTQELQGSDQERHHVRRCPVCGTFYRYDLYYEYSINGGEDTEELARLTPTQARRFLSDAGYEALIGWMAVGLKHANALARRYAAKCLVSHYLARHELALAAQCLQVDDREAAGGALAFLAWSVENSRDGSELKALAELQALFEELARASERSIADPARYIAGQLANNAKRAGRQG